MRMILLAAGLSLVGAVEPALAAAALPPAQLVAAPEVKAHVGQTIAVEAAVSGVHHARSGAEVTINLSGKYPNNALSLVVFKRDLSKFSNLDALNGKTVHVVGAVKLYRGKPEIVLSDPSQIKIKST